MPMVYELARQAAQDVRRQWANHQRPLNFETLRAIAAGLGASVHVTKLPVNKSGMIIKYAGSAPRIYISDAELPARQLFTLAHELGHLWERREVAHDDEYSFVDNRDGGKNLHEFFANEFAGALLMPADTLCELEADGQNVAQCFGVTESALAERKRRLQVHPE